MEKQTFEAGAARRCSRRLARHDRQVPGESPRSQPQADRVRGAFALVSEMLAQDPAYRLTPAQDADRAPLR